MVEVEIRQDWHASDKCAWVWHTTTLARVPIVGDLYEDPFEERYPVARVTLLAGGKVVVNLPDLWTDEPFDKWYDPEECKKNGYEINHLCCCEGDPNKRIHFRGFEVPNPCPQHWPNY